MPAYNAGSTIAESVAGALAQGASEPEPIIVDDDSDQPVVRALRPIRGDGPLDTRVTVVAQLYADDWGHKFHIEGRLAELSDPAVGDPESARAAEWL